VKLDRCELCGAFIPRRRRRRLCWLHLVALRELGILVAAVAAVLALSVN
jgi:hypothetical protein